MSSHSSTSPDPEKTAHYGARPSKEDPERVVGDIADFEDHEVFKQDASVNFRTVGWPRATVIFLKIIFATGVLSIPVAMASLGAVGGALSVLGWGMLNTVRRLPTQYTASRILTLHFLRSTPRSFKAISETSIPAATASRTWHERSAG